VSDTLERRALSGEPSEAERLLAIAPLQAVLRLAVPTTAVMVLGATSGVLHTYFVSRLGAESIAAVSLVFPINLIMTTMMGGGVGAGVSAAIAQALGAGRRADAERVAEHAMVITLTIAAGFTLGLVLGAPTLFRAMGGQGAVLDGAVVFSRVLFGGSAITFTISTFDSILRGQGNVRVPSLCATLSLTLQIVFTPICMFLLGMGLPGAAVATLAGQLIGVIPRAGYLFGGRATVRVRLLPARFSTAPIRDILAIGIPASIATMANYLALMLLTAVVARYGTEEIAAFGLGTRLDFFVVTIAFGVGSAVLTLVGLASGAGDSGRVRAVVGRAVALTATLLGAIALVLVVRPTLWLDLFTREPAIVGEGTRYLRAIAPSYPFVGVSMILAFAFQGIGRPLVSLAVMLARTTVVVVGAMTLAAAGAPVSDIFLLMAAGNVTSSVVLMTQFRRFVREGRVRSIVTPAREPA
jgi:putative MATE family efflux protein